MSGLEIRECSLGGFPDAGASATRSGTRLEAESATFNDLISKRDGRHEIRRVVLMRAQT